MGHIRESALLAMVRPRRGGYHRVRDRSSRRNQQIQEIAQRMVLLLRQRMLLLLLPPPLMKHLRTSQQRQSLKEKMELQITRTQKQVSPSMRQAAPRMMTALLQSTLIRLRSPTLKQTKSISRYNQNPIVL